MFKRDKYAPKNIQAIVKVKERRLNNLNFISLNWTSQKLPDKVQRHWISKYSSLCWHGRYRHPLTSEYFYLGNWGQAERSLDIEPAISKPTLTMTINMTDNWKTVYELKFPQQKHSTGHKRNKQNTCTCISKFLHMIFVIRGSLKNRQ